MTRQYLTSFQLFLLKIYSEFEGIIWLLNRISARHQAERCSYFDCEIHSLYVPVRENNEILF